MVVKESSVTWLSGAAASLSSRNLGLSTKKMAHDHIWPFVESHPSPLYGIPHCSIESPTLYSFGKGLGAGRCSDCSSNSSCVIDRGDPNQLLHRAISRP